MVINYCPITEVSYCFPKLGVRGLRSVWKTVTYICGLVCRAMLTTRSLRAATIARIPALITVKTAQRLHSISISISIRVRILVQLRIGRLFRCANAYAHAIAHANAYANADANAYANANATVARFSQYRNPVAPTQCCTGPSKCKILRVFG